MYDRYEAENVTSMLFYSSRQTNQIRPFIFLGESMARQSAFRFYLTFIGIRPIVRKKISENEVFAIHFFHIHQIIAYLKKS